MAATFFERYIQQSREASELMRAHADYAVSLGCTVFQDEITVHTDKQWELIARWWKEHTT